MGTTENKAENSYELSINHPRFHNFKLLTVQGRRNMETHMGIDEKDYMKWKKQMENKQPQNSEFLLLPHKHQFNSNGLCGSSGTLKLNYFDYPHLLISEIEDRVGTRKNFTEEELWYLLYGLSSAKANMKPAFSKVGDIRPHNIFINDHGKFKVGNLYSWPRQNTNYGKFFEKDVTYLSPEEINQLQHGLAEKEENQSSEMFSIGLTILSAATLEDYSSLYETKNNTFDKNGLSSKLDKFKIFSMYSDILKGTVLNLCEFSPDKRLTPQELWEFLCPHEECIKKRESFVIQNAPIKVHGSVTELRQTVALMHKNTSIVQDANPIQYSTLSGSQPNPTVSTYNTNINMNNMNNMSNGNMNNMNNGSVNNMNSMNNMNTMNNVNNMNSSLNGSMYNNNMNMMNGSMAGQMNSSMNGQMPLNMNMNQMNHVSMSREKLNFPPQIVRNSYPNTQVYPEYRQSMPTEIENKYPTREGLTINSSEKRRSSSPRRSPSRL